MNQQFQTRSKPALQHHFKVEQDEIEESETLHDMKIMKSEDISEDDIKGEDVFECYDEFYYDEDINADQSKDLHRSKKIKVEQDEITESKKLNHNNPDNVFQETPDTFDLTEYCAEKENITGSSSNEKINKDQKKCPDCTFIYTKLESLELHKIVHESKRPYKCKECRHSTSAANNFNHHIITHTKDNPHKCPHCDASFSRLSNMVLHIKFHHPQFMVKCNQCQFTSIKQSIVDKHKDKKHSENSHIILNCNQCTFIYTKPATLELHKIVHLSDPPYQCTKCEYSGNVAKFNRHIFFHTKDKPHLCPHCTSSYSQYHDLQTHIKKKHPGCFLKCDECDFSAVYPDVFKVHKEEHFKVKHPNVLKCKRCNFIYTKLESLELHKNVHTVSPHFQCSICDCTIADAHRFNYHILAHNDDKPYSCNYCSFCCRSHDMLKSHVIIKHPAS